MRDAVKAVAPQPELSGEIQGQGIGRGHIRQRMVESGVEDGDGGHVRQQAQARLDPVGGRWVVQRSQFAQGADRCDNLRVEARWPDELRSAMHNPVAKRLDLYRRVRRGGFRRGQLREDLLCGLRRCVRRNRARSRRLPDGRDPQTGLGRPDPIQKPLCQRFLTPGSRLARLVLHSEQPEL